MNHEFAKAAKTRFVDALPLQLSIPTAECASFERAVVEGGSGCIFHATSQPASLSSAYTSAPRGY